MPSMRRGKHMGNTTISLTTWYWTKQDIENTSECHPRRSRRCWHSYTTKSKSKTQTTGSALRCRRGWQELMNNTLGILPDRTVGNTTLPHVIVGDEAFPLKRYLMRPFPRENLNFEKRIFNYRLSRCRRVAENAFGIYTAQWRVFQRPLQCKWI